MRTILQTAILCVLATACGDGRDDYVGNWRGPGVSLKITRSRFLWLRMLSIGPDNEIRGHISGWKGPAPIVDLDGGGWLFALDADGEVDIREAPARKGGAWTLRLGEATLQRISDHDLNHPLFPDEFPEHRAAEEDLAPILARGTVPPSHHLLVGHWRGLSLDIIIAHDAQVRAEIITASEIEVVDGIVEDWSDDEIEIRTRRGKVAVSLEGMPRLEDGQWRMKMNGEEVVRVRDQMPVGARGEWTTPSRFPSWGGMVTLYQHSCSRGYYNACILLSRMFDTSWDPDDAMVDGPAKIGDEVYCCQRCKVEQSFTPHRCEGCTPLMADGACEGPTPISCASLEDHWDPTTGVLECRISRPDSPPR